MIVNECEGCKGQPVPGVLSHDLSKEFPPEFPLLERCDLCQRFGSDAVAFDVFEVIRWARTVIDSWPEDEDGAMDESLKALDECVGDMLDDRSVVA